MRESNYSAVSETSVPFNIRPSGWNRRSSRKLNDVGKCLTLAEKLLQSHSKKAHDPSVAVNIQNFKAEFSMLDHDQKKQLGDTIKYSLCHGVSTDVDSIGSYLCGCAQNNDGCSASCSGSLFCETDCHEQVLYWYRDVYNNTIASKKLNSVNTNICRVYFEKGLILSPEEKQELEKQHGYSVYKYFSVNHLPGRQSAKPHTPETAAKPSGRVDKIYSKEMDQPVTYNSVFPAGGFGSTALIILFVVLLVLVIIGVVVYWATRKGNDDDDL